MTLQGKYQVIEATSSEALAHHRRLSEETLANRDLSPDCHAAIISKMNALLSSIVEEPPSTKEPERKKEGEGGSTGKKGGGGGGETMHEDTAHEPTEPDILSDIEVLALLLVRPVHELEIAELGHPSVLFDKALAAETLIFIRANKAAKICGPYTLARETETHTPTAFLPALEQHAAKLGAETLQVKVHPDAIEHFQEKLGYTPVGEVYDHMGTLLQRMKKSLSTPHLDFDSEG